MIFRLTHPVLLLIAACFAAACSTPEHVTNARRELAAGEFARALRFANAAVKQTPDDPQALLVRAMAIAEVGVRRPVTDRKQHYETLRRTLNKADSIAKADGRNGTRSEIRVEWVNAWVREYNAGVRILANKEGVKPDQAQQAIRNFEHAQIILPDSVVAAVMQARACAVMSDFARASELLETAREKDARIADRFKIDYALLFSKAGNHIDALPLFEDLFRARPKDFTVGSGLYNTYTKMGLHSAAQSVMEQLFDLNPSDDALKFNQGVRQYYELEERLRAISRRARREKVPDQELFTSSYSEVEEQVQKLEFLFTGAANKAPDKPLLQYAPGVFYFNLGVLYGDLSQFLTDREMRLKFLDVRNELFKRSLPYLKISFGAIPDDKEIWNLLYQVYSTLGMKTEADVSLRNATS